MRPDTPPFCPPICTQGKETRKRKANCDCARCTHFFLLKRSKWGEEGVRRRVVQYAVIMHHVAACESQICALSDCPTVIRSIDHMMKCVSKRGKCQNWLCNESSSTIAHWSRCSIVKCSTCEDIDTLCFRDELVQEANDQASTSNAADKLITEQMKALLHVNKCKNEKHCNFPHCSDWSKVEQHSSRCKDTNCKVVHCASSNAIWTHLERCEEKRKCRFCSVATGREVTEESIDMPILDWTMKREKK
ncbi:hypothetical protein PFISCL1PPCAC_11072 [Pristionchus fissidentatus]|uniref:histone acetyltransferase n=1 Tax=Pristionchus fissidentatus TaxID=1538716 RepID=A0AAV5VJC6_9BILA|nr:hypothetical protein PFISCL1PPCAC_11072 [Pristionchus fissidentatus]